MAGDAENRSHSHHDDRAAFLTGPCLAAYPNIRYTLSSLSAETIVSRLDRFEIDLGLTYLDDKVIEGFEKLHLFEGTLCIARGTQCVSGIHVDMGGGGALAVVSADRKNAQPAGHRRGLPASRRSARRGSGNRFAVLALRARERSRAFSIVPHSLLNFFDLANRVRAISLSPPLTAAHRFDRAQSALPGPHHGCGVGIWRGGSRSASPVRTPYSSSAPANRRYDPRMKTAYITHPDCLRHDMVRTPRMSRAVERHP